MVLEAYSFVVPKTDTMGEGATANLSPLTMRLVAAWLEASQLKEGPLFVRVVGSKAGGFALTAQVVTGFCRRLGSIWTLDGHSNANALRRTSTRDTRRDGAGGEGPG